MFDFIFANKEMEATRREMRIIDRRLVRLRWDIPDIAIRVANVRVYHLLDRLEIAIQIKDCMSTIEEMQEIAEETAE